MSAPLITVLAATNRPDSRTLPVATHYHAVLERLVPGAATLLSLEGREVWRRSEELIRLEQDLLIPTRLFFFVMPEYNGSFPGILKTMMDHTDIRKVWWGKQAVLTGLADGRGGNLRGLDHMTGILHYLKVDVWRNKLPLSRINDEMDAAGNFLKDETKAVIDAQIAEALRWAGFL